MKNRTDPIAISIVLSAAALLFELRYIVDLHPDVSLSGLMLATATALAAGGVIYFFKSDLTETRLGKLAANHTDEFAKLGVVAAIQAAIFVGLVLIGPL